MGIVWAVNEDFKADMRLHLGAYKDDISEETINLNA